MTQELPLSLHQLVINNDYEGITNALAQDADINADSGDAVTPTPLFTAIKREDPEMVRFLCQRGADVNFVSQNDQTPLLYMMLGSDDDFFIENLEIVRILYEYGANTNECSVHCAIGKSHKDTALFFLQRNVAPDVNNPLMLIHYAAEKGIGRDVTKELIVRGADLRALNHDGLAAIHIAALHSYHEEEPDEYEEEDYIGVIRAIIEHDQSMIDFQNPDGETALSIAIDKANMFLVEQLVNLGASLDIAPDGCNNILDYAEEALDDAEDVSLQASLQEIQNFLFERFQQDGANNEEAANNNDDAEIEDQSYNHPAQQDVEYAGNLPDDNEMEDQSYDHYAQQDVGAMGNLSDDAADM